MKLELRYFTDCYGGSCLSESVGEMPWEFMKRHEKKVLLRKTPKSHQSIKLMLEIRTRLDMLTFFAISCKVMMNKPNPDRWRQETSNMVKIAQSIKTYTS